MFDSKWPYDSIMGQSLIFGLRVAISLYHYSLKFLRSHGVGEIKRNMELAEER